MNESLIRASLWVSVPFNWIAAYAVCWPGSALGQLFGLPSPVPAVYTLMLGFFIAGFGLVYAWLAASTEIDRAVLTMGAVGKSGVFVIVFSLWAGGTAPLAGVIVTSGDLAFALLWASWLLRTRKR